ncbi:MAG: hypothetical protein HYR75_06090 [Gemmatimonadetes bacterium]|nr:hypothetical protein [Gemmatimonadota bacterium]MBI3566941.1 hypothetical protein [Gemmatimonadota bacterium]
MTGPARPGAGGGDAPGVSGFRRVAIGCVTAWLGMFSGAMILVLVSKIFAYVTHAPACPGIPSCDWYIYAMVGGAIGALTLPVLVLRVLGKPAKRPKTE